MPSLWKSSGYCTLNETRAPPPISDSGVPDPFRVDVHGPAAVELVRRPPGGLGDDGLLAGRAVTVREGVADRPAQGGDGEVVLVGMAVRELLELAVGRMVRCRAADHRHTVGHLVDPSQDLFLGSHVGDGEQGAGLAAKLLDGLQGCRLAGRETVAIADGGHAHAGLPVGDQHQAGRAAVAGDPAGVLEHAGGRRSAPQRNVTQQPGDARDEALRVVLRRREQDGQGGCSLQLGPGSLDQLGSRSSRVGLGGEAGADCAHETASLSLLRMT